MQASKRGASALKVDLTPGSSFCELTILPTTQPLIFLYFFSCVPLYHMNGKGPGLMYVRAFHHALSII